MRRWSDRPLETEGGVTVNKEVWVGEMGRGEDSSGGQGQGWGAGLVGVSLLSFQVSLIPA